MPFSLAIFVYNVITQSYNSISDMLTLSRKLSGMQVTLGLGLRYKH